MSNEFKIDVNTRPFDLMFSLCRGEVSLVQLKITLTK